MRKQTAFTQWQTRTIAECLITTLGAEPACGAAVEDRDAIQEPRG
jgi:hypothetical protein